MSSKTCIRCHIEKPILEFYRHQMMRDGHLNVCVECVKRRVRAHREANVERIREYDRARNGLPHRISSRADYRKTEAYKLSHNAAARRWDENNPDRKSAQIAVNNAVRDGRLMRLPCFVCGAKAHAHHPDYSAPLAVSWLCPKHHKEAHAAAFVTTESTSMKLYEIAETVETLIETGIDPETGEMSGELVHALGQLQEGGRSVVAYALNCEAQAEAIKAAIARLSARRRALEHRAQRMRDYLRENMARTGITRIDATDATWSARLERDRDESVEVPEGCWLPPHLTRVKVEPDKSRIRAAILAGEPVPDGVRIVRRDRLVIG